MEGNQMVHVANLGMGLNKVIFDHMKGYFDEQGDALKDEKEKTMIAVTALIIEAIIFSKTAGIKDSVSLYKDCVNLIEEVTKDTPDITIQ